MMAPIECLLASGQQLVLAGSPFLLLFLLLFLLPLLLLLLFLRPLFLLLRLLLGFALLLRPLRFFSPSCSSSIRDKL